MAPKAVHEAKSIGSPAITKQNGDLMQSLWNQAPKVPLHIGILQIISGQSLLGVNEVRKLDRIADEKDRRIVSHQVPITYRIKLELS
jgi:hypothetical protein